MEINRLKERLASHKLIASSNYMSAIAVLFIKVAHVGLGILLTILISRSVGLEGLGFYASVFSFSNILSALVSGGLVVFIMRELPSYIENADNAKISYIHNIYKFTTLTILATSAAFSVVVYLIFQDNVFFYVLLMGPLLVASKARSALIRAYGITIESQIEMIAILAIACSVFAGLVGLGVPVNEKSASVVVLISMVFVSANRIVRVRALFHMPSERMSWEKIRSDDYKTIVVLSFVTLVQVLFAELGVVSIQMVGSRGDIGLLKAMTELSGVVGLMFIILNIVYSKSLSLALKKSDTYKVESIAKSCAFTSLAFAIPLSIPLAFFPEQTIGFVYGLEEFQRGADSLRWLAFSQLANCALGPVMMIATLSGHHNVMLVPLAKLLALSVLFNMALYLVFGVVGVAFGMAVSTVSWKLVISSKLKKLTNIKIGLSSIIRIEK